MKRGIELSGGLVPYKQIVTAVESTKHPLCAANIRE